MAHEKLTNELNVAEKLVLSFQHLLFVVVGGVSLASLLSLGNQLFEIVLLEDFLEAISAVVEELFAERAEFKHTWDSLFALRLKVDLDNGRAKLAIEFGVGVFNLGFAENGLNHSVKDFVSNLESLGFSLVKALL